MARIENITREKLTTLLTAYLKECSRQMGTRTNRELNIEFGNYGSGRNKDWKWSYTIIEFGDTTCMVRDKAIEDVEFAAILRNAVAKAKVRANVYTETYGDGYWVKQETRYKGIEIFAKPCKEFVSLVKLVEKYANYTIGDTDVFDVSVCGKRSSWSDSRDKTYLCYNADKCQAIIDYIRKNRTSKDTLTIEVAPYSSHGDDGDYKCAMYQESEWYGYRGARLNVRVTTPSGRVKANNYWALRGYGTDRNEL